VVVLLGLHLHLASLDALAPAWPVHSATIPHHFTEERTTHPEALPQTHISLSILRSRCFQTFYTVSASALPLGAPRRLKPNSATSLGEALLSQRANILALPHLPSAASSVLALELSSAAFDRHSNAQIPCFSTPLLTELHPAES
jgi:hypothetical protein